MGVKTPLSVLSTEKPNNQRMSLRRVMGVSFMPVGSTDFSLTGHLSQFTFLGTRLPIYSQYSRVCPAPIAPFCLVGYRQSGVVCSPDDSLTQQSCSLTRQRQKGQRRRGETRILAGDHVQLAREGKPWPWQYGQYPLLQLQTDRIARDEGETQSRRHPALDGF